MLLYFWVFDLRPTWIKKKRSRRGYSQWEYLSPSQTYFCELLPLQSHFTFLSYFLIFPSNLPISWHLYSIRIHCYIDLHTPAPYVCASSSHVSSLGAYFQSSLYLYLYWLPWYGDMSKRKVIGRFFFVATERKWKRDKICKRNDFG